MQRVYRLTGKKVNVMFYTILLSWDSLIGKGDRYFEFRWPLNSEVKQSSIFKIVKQINSVSLWSLRKVDSKDEFASSITESINESKYGLITWAISGQYVGSLKKKICCYIEEGISNKNLVSGIFVRISLKMGDLWTFKRPSKCTKARCDVFFSSRTPSLQTKREGRRIICSIPILDIKIKKEIWALVYLTTHRKNCESCPSQETISWAWMPGKIFLSISLMF